MIENKSAIWLFIIATIFLFGVVPIYDQQLTSTSVYFGYLVQLLFLFWFIALVIVVWSFGIIFYMLDRHHWFTPIMIGIMYVFLTKQARKVAKDFYRFNFFKGDEN